MSLVRLRVWTLCVALCASVFVVAINAQQPASRASVNLIVTDNKGTALDDVKQEQIQLSEDGNDQVIKEFAKTTLPVSYCILIDTSGSFRSLLPKTIEFAKLIASNNSPGDDTCLIRFTASDQIQKVSDFTSDRQAIIQLLDVLKTLPGQSAVIDAIYMATHHTATHAASVPDRRRAVVLISDGQDRQSYYKEKDLINLLRKSDVQVFVLGITDQLDDVGGLIRPGPRQTAEALLERVAAESGGRVFRLRSKESFNKAAEEIVHDLHTQYVIGYERAGEGKKGFKEIKVKVSNPPDTAKRIAVTRRRVLVN